MCDAFKRTIHVISLRRREDRRRQTIRTCETVALTPIFFDAIEDIEHGRNALARVSRFGSPHEKAEVRAAVHARYPSIACTHCGSHYHRTHEHHLHHPRKVRRSRHHHSSTFPSLHVRPITFG